MLEYRAGTETDLDNVLQIRSVFLSVGKGQTAPAQDLARVFGPNTPLDAIVLEILAKGELQVGERERHAQLERVHAEVVDLVAARLVDPSSKRVYTAGMVAKALDQLSGLGARRQEEGRGKGAGAEAGGLKEEGGEEEEDGEREGMGKAKEKEKEKEKAKELPTWTGVTTTRSAKSQALDAIKALIAWQPMPVMRARMRLRVTCPTGLLKQPVKAGPKGANKAAAAATGADDGGTDEKEKEKAKGTIKERILHLIEQVETQDVVGEEWEVTGFVEPGAFKALGELVGAETKGRGRVEVLDVAVVHEGD